MSDWDLIDHDPYTGLRVYHGYDEETDSVLVRHEQDAQSLQYLLDQNKATQADDFDRSSDFWHAAKVPIGVLFEWITKHGVDAWNPAHRDGVKRLLNSDEYRWCRVNHFIL